MLHPAEAKHCFDKTSIPTLKSVADGSFEPAGVVLRICEHAYRCLVVSPSTLIATVTCFALARSLQTATAVVRIESVLSSATAGAVTSAIVMIPTDIAKNLRT